MALECSINSTRNIIYLKNTKILVNVDDALQDVLVVSFAFDNSIFRGILLDSSSKRTFPTGITLPNLSTSKNFQKSNGDNDLLKAINQRFTYFQELPLNGHKLQTKRNKNSKIPKNQMRLRPRQVLCSKCKNVCSENNDRVTCSTNTTKIPVIANTNGDKPGSKLALAVENSRRSLCLTSLSTLHEKTLHRALYDNKNNQLITHSEVTPSMSLKFERLLTTDLDKTCRSLPQTNGFYTHKTCSTNVIVASPKSAGYTTESTEKELVASLPKTGDINMEDAQIESIKEEKIYKNDERKMVLRKKHSIGSMEDLWDESVLEEHSHKNTDVIGTSAINDTGSTKTIPVLKITFGSEGQGTILKIPNKNTNDFDNHDDDENSSSDVPRDQKHDESHVETRSMLKAARKAHKKAKKEAKKRMIADCSTKHLATSANHFTHKSKHKIKKKKKHKVRSSAMHGNNVTNFDRKNNEKLSMSFKRVGGNAYCATRTIDCTNTCSTTMALPLSSPRDSSTSPIQVQLPESSSKQQFINISDNGYSFKTKSGKAIEVDDIIWAKKINCTWWPAKVISFKVSVREHDLIYASVLWFDSQKNSVVSCDNICLFLDNYKMCFDKHKISGQYKSAVDVATTEAKKKRGLQMRSSSLSSSLRF